MITEFIAKNIYDFEAISYLEDPDKTDLWKNSYKPFKCTLAAGDLEEAIKLCREYAKNIDVKDVSTSHSDWLQGEFCIIGSIKHKGNAYFVKGK